MKKIVILGTGGTSRDILDTINDLNDKEPNLECIGFLDDDKAGWDKKINGVKVLGALSSVSKYKDAFFVNGIGSPSNFIFKKKIIDSLKINPKKFITLTHPTASISRTASIGYGTVIFQNVTVTTNVKVGKHVVILPNSILSHDSQIGDYCCIAGGVCISGQVNIGKSCYVGTNSTIKQGVNIGASCLIGMGSVVIKDVSKESIVVGNPARLLRKINEKK